MNRMRAVMAVVAIAVLALIGAATPSQASGVWSNFLNTSSPTIYQTNYTYQSANIVNPYTTIPPASTITYVGWSWQLNNPIPAGKTLDVTLCEVNSARCTLVSSATTASSGSGTNYTVFTGLNAANSKWYYTIRLNYSSTVSIFPNIPSKQYGINVGYN